MSISLNSATPDSLLTELTAELSARKHTPDWLKLIQLDNAKCFTQLPFPTRKTEHWKYNDLSGLLQKQFTLSANADPETQQNQAIENCSLPLVSPIRLVFVDGLYRQDLSSELSVDGVQITSFDQATEQQVSLITENFKTAAQTKNPFINLNTALSNSGLLIEIEKNKKISQPIYLLNVFSNKDSQQLATNHNVIYCGEGSESEVIEHFTLLENSTPVEQQNGSMFSNQQTIIEIDKNSRCSHHRISIATQNLTSIARVLYRLKQDAQLTSFYFSEGGLLDRTDIDVMHQGSNSESNMNGIYLPSQNNCVDFHTCIQHQVPHCTSRETFRGIIADSAKATFNGKIHIFKDAQKSDAQLSNKNLLLTNRAEINTKPELEIYADDVVCAHGATIAKIDDKAIYYLKTRGINEMQAKKMLSIGFINELLQEVDNAELKTYLSDFVQKSLANLR